MGTRKLLKYGLVRGDMSKSVNAPIGADEVITITGSRFVTQDGSGNYEICTASSATIAGHLECEAFTAAAVEGVAAGGDRRLMIIDFDAIFRIPIISGTYTDAQIGNCCDLVVSGTQQGAAVTTNSHDLLVITDGDATEAWVEVRMNAAKRYTRTT